LVGFKYSAPFVECATQEYLLQLGGLSKAGVTFLICGLALFIATRTAAPSHSALVCVTVLVVVLSFLCVALSISFKTARIFCTYDGDVQYSDASQSTKDAVVAYISIIFVPIYICLTACAIFSIMLQKRLGRIVTRTSLISSGQATEEQQLMHVVSRMRLYPLIVLMSWLPCTALFIMNTIGRHSGTLNLIATVFLASSGIGISLTYFNYQKTYPSFVMGIVYPMHSRGDSLLVTETRGGVESLGGSWSEGPSSSGGSNLTGGSLSELAMARTSTMFSAGSTGGQGGRTYSLAQSLLPRFFSRSRSATTGPTASTDSTF
jgi:hypothetical protein